MLRPSGGILQFLFHLRRPKAGQARPKEPTNALGKLEIKWRNAMGEVQHCNHVCAGIVHTHRYRLAACKRSRLLGRAMHGGRSASAWSTFPGSYASGRPLTCGCGCATTSTGAWGLLRWDSRLEVREAHTLTTMPVDVV